MSSTDIPNLWVPFTLLFFIIIAAVFFNRSDRQ